MADKNMAHPSDRAGGPDGLEPRAASQPEALIPCAEACFDCNTPYGDEAWIEAVVPHDIWNNHLSPTGNEGGILCITCMAKRAVKAGLSNVPLMLRAGPFVGVGDV